MRRSIHLKHFSNMSLSHVHIIFRFFHSFARTFPVVRSWCGWPRGLALQRPGVPGLGGGVSKLWGFWCVRIRQNLSDFFCIFWWFKLKAFLQIARCLRCFVFAFGKLLLIFNETWLRPCTPWEWAQHVWDLNWNCFAFFQLLSVTGGALSLIVSQEARCAFSCCCVVVCGALHKETVDRPWPMAQMDRYDRCQPVSFLFLLKDMFRFDICKEILKALWYKWYKTQTAHLLFLNVAKRTRLQVSSSEVRSKQEKTSG